MKLIHKTFRVLLWLAVIYAVGCACFFAIHYGSTLGADYAVQPTDERLPVYRCLDDRCKRYVYIGEV